MITLLNIKRSKKISVKNTGKHTILYCQTKIFCHATKSFAKQHISHTLSSDILHITCIIYIGSMGHIGHKVKE